MDDHDITMEEYIRLEEEKSRRHGNVYNWKTATYGKIWYDEDVHDLRSVEIEFPAIVFNDMLISEPTISSLINEIDFRISFDESEDEDYTVIYEKNSFSYKIIYVDDLKTDSENDSDKFNMPSFLSPEPTDAIRRILGFWYGVLTTCTDFVVKKSTIRYTLKRRVLNSYEHSDINTFLLKNSKESS
nr:hypothetical protein [Tanacetum cinerariifolium]